MFILFPFSDYCWSDLILLWQNDVLIFILRPFTPAEGLSDTGAVYYE
jgi:hypothetical protein